MWEQVMDELRDEHLESRPRRDDGVLTELNMAARRIAAERGDRPGSADR